MPPMLLDAMRFMNSRHDSSRQFLFYSVIEASRPAQATCGEAKWVSNSRREKCSVKRSKRRRSWHNIHSLEHTAPIRALPRNIRLPGCLLVLHIAKEPQTCSTDQEERKMYNLFACSTAFCTGTSRGQTPHRLFAIIFRQAKFTQSVSRVSFSAFTVSSTLKKHKSRDSGGTFILSIQTKTQFPSCFVLNSSHTPRHVCFETPIQGHS